MREDVGRSIGLSARKVQVCVNTRGFRAQLLVIDHVSDLVPGEKKICNRSKINVDTETTV